jgi:hypothetical protein
VKLIRSWLNIKDMPPNQNQNPSPLPGPGDPGHDPYAFFMSPQKPQRPSLLNLGGGKSKVWLIVGGIVFALILIIIGVSVASSAGKSKTLELLSVVQTQQEIIRVATDGTKNARSTDLQNLANTTVVSLSSDQHQLLAVMQKQGTKVSPKELDLGKNSQTDQALSVAQAANTYDTTFASTMDSELSDYENKLDSAAKTATTTAGINLLKKEMDNAAQLHKELQSLQSNP